MPSPLLSPFAFVLPFLVATTAQEPAPAPPDGGPAKPEAPAGETPPASEPSSTPPSAPTAPPAAEPAPSPPPSGEAPPAPEAPPREPEAPKPGLRGSIGLHAGITGGVGPGVAPMGGLYFDLAMMREGIFSPSFRIGFDIAGSVNSIDNGGSHFYVMAGGNARVCPIWVPVASTLRVGPCAGIVLGWYKGGASDVVNASQFASAWVAPTLGASVDWAVSSKISLELAGGLLFPLERQVFLYAPRTILHEVPQVTGGVTVGGRLAVF
ncbi:MAG: hypothetical protein JST00_39025 [Deltaproteobacteria bacterium]|nr:hypothetical protein [Deltaproteobacteria bacterium]